MTGEAGMALKETVNTLKNLLTHIHGDLEKSLRGNRTASQRVRTQSIKFAKIAKIYRKESVAEAKKALIKKGNKKKR